MPIPLMAIGSIAQGIGTIAAGIGQAKNAKQQAKAQAMQQRWDNFVGELSNMRANFIQSQQYAFAMQHRKQVGDASIKTLASQERAIRDSLDFSTAAASRSYQQLADSLESSAETRGIDTTRGSASLLSKSAQAGVINDMLSLRRQADAALTNAREDRKNTMANLGPVTAPLANYFFPSTISQMPNTSGILVGSLLSGMGSILGGAEALQGKS